MVSDYAYPPVIFLGALAYQGRQRSVKPSRKL